MRKRRDKVEYTPLGFQMYHNPVVAMPVAHRHDEVEVGVGENGSSVLLYGGQRLVLEEGSLVVFWASIPHQVLEVSGNLHSYSLTIPLTWLLGWGLPGSFINRLLEGVAQIDHEPSRLKENLTLVKRWRTDLAEGTAEGREIVLLELEARLRRLARYSQPVLSPPNQADKVAQIAAHIARHYQEPFSAAAIGAAVGLHPRSAMRLYRQICGLSLLNHVILHRIAHAQRLLITTDDKIVAVAMASGFSSLSRFYKAFQDVCQLTPTEYRQQIGGGPF